MLLPPVKLMVNKTTFQLVAIPIEKTENTTLTFTRKEKEKIVGYCADADDIKSLLLQHTKTIFFEDSNIVH